MLPIATPLQQVPWWGKIILETDFSKLAGVLEKLVRKRKSEDSGTPLYETLEYESTLDIHNKQGTRATFTKRKKVRYLQPNVFVFPDYAWGDGEILLNYKTSRGYPVDRYRSGYKTYVLLSLREVMDKGDQDEFNIQWDIREGFQTDDGYWSTSFSQPAKSMKMNVLFPKTRPPKRALLEETNQKRTVTLGPEHINELPGGRWRISWGKANPSMHEIYVLRWEW